VTHYEKTVPLKGRGEKNWKKIEKSYRYHHA